MRIEKFTIYAMPYNNNNKNNNNNNNNNNNSNNKYKMLVKSRILKIPVQTLAITAIMSVSDQKFY